MSYRGLTFHPLPLSHLSQFSRKETWQHQMAGLAKSL
jgi:hypothetical protein